MEAVDGFPLGFVFKLKIPPLTLRAKPSSSSSSRSGPPARRIRLGIFPTLVSSKNFRIAGTALSSPKRRRTDKALAFPHPQSLSTLLQSLLFSGSHLLHLTKRWKRVCRSPLQHHQQLSLWVWPTRTKCSVTTACPDRSW